jgi:hypothetical protein
MGAMGHAKWPICHGVRWALTGSRDFDRPAMILAGGHTLTASFLFCRPIADDFLLRHPFSIFHFPSSPPLKQKQSDILFFT